MNIQRLGTRFFESIAIFAAFFLIAFTFYGFGVLTPTLNSNADKLVLGAKTSTKLYYYPVSTKNVSIVKESQLNLENNETSNAELVISFSEMTPSSYNFPVMQIKNDTEFPAKIKISPSFSENNSGIVTEIVVDGIAIPVMDVNGALLIPEVTVEPKSILPVSIKLSTEQKINMETKLTLSFIRFE